MKTFTTILSILLSITIVSAQNKALPYQELEKHLPSEIRGYRTSSDPEGSSFEMNGMSYSSASVQYNKGDSDLSITIFDYQGAANMYSSASLAWVSGAKYEDDQQKAYGIEIDGFKGWFVLDKEDNSCETIVGYKDRYIITVNVTNVDEEFAKSLFKELNLKDLP